MGIYFALIGAALSFLLAGIGSSIGVGMAGEAAAGALAEDPSKVGKLMVLQLLPGTPGIYGFVVALLTLIQIGGVGGNVQDLSWIQGLLYFAACLPMGFVGLWSAKRQGRAAVSSIGTFVKKPEQFGKLMLFPAMVELYAIFALIISLLALLGIGNLKV